jgi:hypothetical protein
MRAAERAFACADARALWPFTTERGLCLRGQVGLPRAVVSTEGPRRVRSWGGWNMTDHVLFLANLPPVRRRNDLS